MSKNNRLTVSKSSNHRLPTYLPFFALFEKKAGGCWIWIGPTIAKYGAVYRHGRIYKAHRYSWELVNGPIPEGMLVCHHCDVPLCVNPDHLFLGTPLDNVLDMIKKGRAVYPPGRRPKSLVPR